MCARWRGNAVVYNGLCVVQGGGACRDDVRLCDGGGGLLVIFFPGNIPCLSSAVHKVGRVLGVVGMRVMAVK